ncbi:MAG: glycosyl hydrolase family 8 [bacterium]|nr:glycosyl hydrolase family 8 [bacterium]
MKKVLIALLLGIGMLSLIIGSYINSSYSSKTRVFSSYSLLSSTWEKYKATFITEDGRVIDFSQDDMTTSEGQSYAMLRAVWSDDKETFDLVWEWTKVNLQRKDDKLFGWHWGELDDGSYGFKENGGNNAAADADSDIALALFFASKRWRQPSYEGDALEIIDDIWNNETAELNGKRYSIAGNWANSQTEIVLNPSYFMPYTWRIFAEADPDHDWLSLITPAYEVLEQSSNMELRGETSVGLPPNWISLNKETGVLQAPSVEALSTTYSYDAMRVPWRIAVDYIWYEEPRALSYLQSLDFFSELYTRDGRLTSSYSHNGTPLADYESPAMYATVLPYFQLVEPVLAEQMYNTKLLPLYSNDTNTFKDELNYYDQNWVWFSLALYTSSLPNLYQDPSAELGET